MENKDFGRENELQKTEVNSALDDIDEAKYDEKSEASNMTEETVEEMPPMEGDRGEADLEADWTPLKKTKKDNTEPLDCGEDIDRESDGIEMPKEGAIEEVDYNTYNDQENIPTVENTHKEANIEEIIVSPAEKPIEEQTDMEIAPAVTEMAKKAKKARREARREVKESEVDREDDGSIFKTKSFRKLWDKICLVLLILAIGLPICLLAYIIFYFFT